MTFLSINFSIPKTADKKKKRKKKLQKKCFFLALFKDHKDIFSLHKAVEVIKTQMEKDGESPLLYCMLGDATDDPANYEKAIELSNERSGRALRSLGSYYYQKKEYEKAVEYFGKSLALNSFQLKTLLRHGYAAMQIKAWDVAAQSYRNYCIYESDVSKN